MYYVQRGDTPMSIAHRFTGDPMRSRDLVLANPQKKKQVMGGILTFTTLGVGERLALPRSWGRAGMGVAKVRCGDASGVPCGGCANTTGQTKGPCNGCTQGVPCCNGCANGGPCKGDNKSDATAVITSHAMGMSGPRTGFGAYSPSYTVVGGATAVDPASVANACSNFVTPSSWPAAMTTQAVNIDSVAQVGDTNFVVYENKLYMFSTAMGGGKKDTTLQVCTDFNPNALSAQQCPPGTTFDPSSGNCVTAAGPGNSCPSGTVFNPDTGKCEAVPGQTTTGGGLQPVGWVQKIQNLSTPWKVALGIAVVAAGGGVVWWATKPSGEKPALPPSHRSHP